MPDRWDDTTGFLSSDGQSRNRYGDVIFEIVDISGGKVKIKRVYRIIILVSSLDTKLVYPLLCCLSTSVVITLPYSKQNCLLSYGVVGFISERGLYAATKNNACIFEEI